MNYGYHPTSRDAELMARLKPIVILAAGSLPVHERPYLERDGLYPGVRMRHLTHLHEADLEALIQAADRVYEEIVK